ncbi:MAG: hypothetical protein J6Y22_11570 [Paludibacteraceae bacterium]|nr:hypothetical protein [Paludibacteraceae bacterium]
MANDFLESLNKISEVFNDHYSVRIQMKSDLDILKIIDESYKYVWILDHSEYLSEWTPSCNLLFNHQSDSDKVFIRKDSMEILMETKYFCDLLKGIGSSRCYWHIIQTNVKPPYFLDLKKFAGKNKYNMLKQHADYLFELEQMADCEQIISSKKEILVEMLYKLGIP